MMQRRNFIMSLQAGEGGSLKIMPAGEKELYTLDAL